MDFKLGFNIDHVATLRNARNEGYPNLLKAADFAIKGGAKQITAHLREDRRHIKDKDVYDLKSYLNVDLNMEIAATQEMIDIACKVKPYSVCLVPERRQELTTEGGLNVIACFDDLYPKILKLKEHNIKISLFLDAIENQIFTALKLSIDAIEINTGKYANLFNDILAKLNGNMLVNYEEAKYLLANNKEHFAEVFSILKDIENMAKFITQEGKEANAGHGLSFYNIEPIALIQEFREFNIGHFLVSEALFMGLQNSIRTIISLIQNVRQ